MKVRGTNELQPKAPQVALGTLRDRKELKVLSAELGCLSTFLQNTPTPCHRTARFPENPGCGKSGSCRKLQVCLHPCSHASGDAPERAISVY